MAQLVKKGAKSATKGTAKAVKLVKKDAAVKTVAVAAKAPEKTVAEKLVNPFVKNPLSRGFWKNGGKRPVVTVTENLSDVGLAKGDSARFLSMLAPGIALVLPGLSGCQNDEGRDTTYDFTQDAVTVPVDALR